MQKKSQEQRLYQLCHLKMMILKDPLMYLLFITSPWAVPLHSVLITFYHFRMDRSLCPNQNKNVIGKSAAHTNVIFLNLTHLRETLCSVTTAKMDSVCTWAKIEVDTHGYLPKIYCCDPSLSVHTSSLVTLQLHITREA